MRQGRCQTCRARIPWRYPLYELLGGIVGVAFIASLASDWVGPGIQGASIFRATSDVSSPAPHVLFDLRAATALLLLLICTEADITSRIVPNSVLVVGITLAGFFAIVGLVHDQGFASHLTATLTLVGVGVSIRAIGAVLYGTPGFGMGDIKLLGVMGLLVGWIAAPALVVAVILAAAFGVAGLATKKLTRKTALPFVPFLTVGFVIAVILVTIVSITDVPISVLPIRLWLN